MPQSDDKIALEELDREIAVLEVYIEWIENDLLIERTKLNKLLERKKSMENYLNGDNN